MSSSLDAFIILENSCNPSDMACSSEPTVPTAALLSKMNLSLSQPAHVRVGRARFGRARGPGPLPVHPCPQPPAYATLDRLEPPPHIAVRTRGTHSGYSGSPSSQGYPSPEPGGRGVGGAQGYPEPGGPLPASVPRRQLPQGPYDREYNG